MIPLRQKSYLGIERPSISDVPLQRLGAELWMDRVVLESMHIYDMLCDVQIALLVALVQHHEEEIETTHDRRSHRNVRAQALLAVVPAADRVRRGEDGRPRVQRRVNARLGDGDRLLFHGLVNRDLVRDVHLVKLVDCADAVVREHERARFDGEVASLLVLDHSRC